MGHPKPLASLTATLLARKGQARPAMRPQTFAPLHSAPIEDLGWNDMGHPADLSATPSAETEVPPVLVEREVLKQEIEAPAVVKSVSVATAARLQRETAHGGKAAFTLRLDAARHLRLRLASAITHRSAQQLVTGALDQMLAGLPEVETLVAQLPATPSKTKRRQG